MANIKRASTETTVAQTPAYRVYTITLFDCYFIEYLPRDPMKSDVWYSTLEDVKEALYYQGLLESKTAPLG